jgi:formylglycine-generating enzyme required for sulfatase activity
MRGRNLKISKSIVASVFVVFMMLGIVDAGEQAKRLENKIGMSFVLIPSGTFMMGSPSSEVGRYPNETQHQVKISKSFYMQTTEVTQGQWVKVMGYNPSRDQNCGNDCPVENVTWNEIKTFIDKLNHLESTDTYRLPTEAEWEYAARAGTATPYYWGPQQDCSKANYGVVYASDCNGKNPGKKMKVASFSPNPWGLYDMLGNLWEWCQDRYGAYPDQAVTDPSGPSSGSNRVYRGGSAINGAVSCRAAYRGEGPQDHKGYALGFRLAKSK